MDLSLKKIFPIILNRRIYQIYHKIFSKKTVVFLSIFISSIIFLYLGIYFFNTTNFFVNSNKTLQENIWEQEMQPNLVSKDAFGNILPEKIWHVVNKSEDLRSYFSENGWTIQPKEISQDNSWQVQYKLIGMSRMGNGAFTQAKLESITADKNNNIVALLYNGITEWYQNTNMGIKQNFYIAQKPIGDGLLLIHGKINTNASIQVSDNVISFFHNTKNVLRIDNLNVTDVNGKKLKSYYKFNSDSNTILYVIDDREAVYPLSIDPLASNPVWIYESDQVNSYLGKSTSTAGDVNGDGYDDVIVGAYTYDNGQENEGKVFVFYGSAIGISAVPDWTVESDQANAQFGWLVSTAGDVNNDGYDDVIVGAYTYDNGESDEGKVFAYYGSVNGLSTVPDWTYESNQANALLGNSISTAGDVNGDGYDDVIVGAVHYSNGESIEGSAFVFYGSENGVSSSPDWQVESNQANSQFANYLSTAGDVNGDGYGDVIIGAHAYDNGQNDEGKAFVYYGSSIGLSASPDWTAESDQANAYFGISVSTVGDVNCDNYDDLAVAAYLYDTDISDAGKVFTYYGSVDGLSPTSDWSVSGEASASYFGRSVSTARDVNADSCDDVIIGVNLYNSGRGRAIVYLGGGNSQINVSSISSNTTEAEGTATFTVSLSTEPISDVTFNISSSEESEGTIAISTLTFTNSNWFIPQTVTVTGVNDLIADGNQSYTIILSAATSSDPGYSGLNPDDVAVINTDDDTAGITVTALSENTTEIGGIGTFTIVLNTQATADVNINITSNDITEGIVSLSSLTFTNSNWATPQVVTVTGVNDLIADGDQSYTIILSAATSSDSGYNGLNLDDVAVINTDDDTAGITVTALSGNTTEIGGTGTFTIVLNTQATADVNINITSSDITEGTVSSSSLTFTNSNWLIPQTVTVTGVNDLIADGNQNYIIIIDAATSLDPGYSGLNPDDVAVINTENKISGSYINITIDDILNQHESSNDNVATNSNTDLEDDKNSIEDDNAQLIKKELDYQNTWAKDYIQKLYDLKIVSGCDDQGNYCPNNYITRAEATKILLKSINFNINNNFEENPFVDLNETHWAYNIILTAYNYGLINGNPNNTFKPDAFINRAEAVKIILTTYGIDIEEDATNLFKDVNDSAWYKNYILTAFKQEIIDGYVLSDGIYYKPDSYITRAEFAKIIVLTGKL